MNSQIVINKQNMLENLENIKKQCKNSQICAMVKANAYGHGLKEVVSILSGKVKAFGVVNIEEALAVREVDQESMVILFGACEDVQAALENNISLTIISVENLKKVAKICKKCQIAPRLQLNINSGMNRFGIKSKQELAQVVKILRQNDFRLEGIFTHFSSLTTDEDYTQRQKQIFDDFVASLPKDFSPLVSVGGGTSIFKCDNYDMYRVGLFLYGYGGFLPVMSVKSRVIALQNVKKGEHVGYMSAFTAQKDIQVAVVPVGYADGIKRGLSNNFSVKINGKTYKNVGNICMDCFMVEVDRHVKVGEEVTIMQNASEWAEKLGTTEYEILTNFNAFRGERVII